MILRILKVFFLILVIISFIFSCADLPGNGNFREIDPLEEDNITCRDIERDIILEFTKDENNTGDRDFHFSVGKDYDLWVMRGGKIYISDIELTFEKSFSAEYLHIEDFKGESIVTVSGIKNGIPGTIQWDGKKNIVPLIYDSHMESESDKKTFKTIRLKYDYDEDKLYTKESSLRIILNLQACGDFTSLSPVLWDTLYMLFWS